MRETVCAEKRCASPYHHGECVVLEGIADRIHGERVTTVAAGFRDHHNNIGPKRIAQCVPVVHVTVRLVL